MRLSRAARTSPGSWKNVRSVARFELECTVKSKGWLITTFGMPVFLLLYAAMISIPAYLAAAKDRKVTVYGVVDEAGVMRMTGEVVRPAVEIPEQIRSALVTAGQGHVLEGPMALWQNFVFRPFADEAAARRAMREGNARGYFRIPSDYLDQGIVDTYTSGRGTDIGGAGSRRAFSSLLQGALLEGKLPEALTARVQRPIAETRAWSVDDAGEVKTAGGAGRFAKILVPLGFALLLVLSTMMSAGALIQATAIEKENKVVEVLLASVKPDELLLGKLLGIGVAGAIQMTVWFGMLAASGLAFVGTLAAMGVETPWAGIAAAILFFPLSYLFFGSLMLGTGSIGSNQKEANQWGMIWSLFVVIPMVFFEMLLREPHGTLARVLTWIPFTTPLTSVLRLTVDPAGMAWWEVLGAIVVLAVATRLAIGFGARLFRVGILLTGARPKLRDIVRQARLS